MQININVSLSQLNELFSIGNTIMATLADIQAALAQAATDATAEKQVVSDALKALVDKVAALQNQIDSGSVVTSADLDAVLASITGLDAQVKGLIDAPAA